MGHKRINNIYDQIYTYENLLKAYRKARKNKRYRTEVLAYTARLSENLLELQEDFKTCTYHPQPYRSFTIYEPKERIIRAPAIQRPSCPARPLQCHSPDH